MNEQTKTKDEADDIYLTAFGVRQRFAGKSDMWLFRLLKSDADFPRPIKVRQQRFWKLSELEAWESKRRVPDESAA